MQMKGKKNRVTEIHGLEKPQHLKGLIDVEDGSVVVDLPNLGTQNLFILTELCIHCQVIFGLERIHNGVQCNNLYSTNLR